MPTIDFTEDVSVDFTPDTSIDFKPDQESPPTPSSDFSPESDYTPPNIQSLKEFFQARPEIPKPDASQGSTIGSRVSAGLVRSALGPASLLLPDSTVEKAATGLARAGIGAVESAATPLTAAIVAGSAIPVVGKPLAIAAGAGFGSSMSIAGAQQFYEAVKAGDVQGAFEGLGNTALGAFMVGGAGRATRPDIFSKPKIEPLDQAIKGETPAEAKILAPVAAKAFEETVGEPKPSAETPPPLPKESDATSLRGNEGQVPQGGNVAEVSQDQGSADLQRNAQAGTEAGNAQGAQVTTVSENPKSYRQQKIDSALESFPFGQSADVAPGTGASEVMTQLSYAIPSVKRRIAIITGKEPFPSREEFLKGVDDNYIWDAMELRQKIVGELSNLGLDTKKAKLPVLEDFKTPGDYYEAMASLETRMRREGVSIASALVETKQMPKPFTKQDFPNTEPGNAQGAQEGQLGSQFLKNETGNDLIAYHGTPETTFDISNIEPSDWGHSGPGIYLTTDFSVADQLYATAHRALPKGRVFAVKVISKKPFGGGVFSETEADTMNKALVNNGYTPVKNLVGKTHKWLFERKEEQAQDTWDLVMKEAGYDSVRIKDADESEMVVYSPDQIVPLQRNAQAGTEAGNAQGAQVADLLRPGPGAKTAGTEVPVESTLEQLTMALKNRTPEEKATPPAERISAFENVADKVTETKDATWNLLSKMKAVGSAIVDSYLNLPKWNNFKEALGEWGLADAKSSLATQRFIKQIDSDIPRNTGRQEAITNWIQADGDAAILSARAQASKGRAKRGYEAALNLSESDKTTARQVSAYLDSKLQEGMDAGILKSSIDNYITQVWRRPNEVASRLFGDLVGGKLGTNFKFARKRIFDSYFEGEQAGYKPLTKDVGGLVAIYDQAFNKTLAGRAFVKSLHENKAEDGLPLTMLEGEGRPVPKGEEIPEAYLIKPHAKPKDAVTENGRRYVRLSHSSLHNWKYLTKTDAGQPIMEQADMLVHPDYAQHLNNILKRSAFRENPYSAALLKGQAFLKATKLSLSLFHQVQEGIHAVFHRINPFHPPEIDLNNPIQADLVRGGLVTVDYNAYSAYSEGLGSHRGLIEKLPGIGKVQQAYSEYLFQDYIPRLKMSMALHAYERNLARYGDEIKSGKLTERQIQELTARQANAAFAELNYKFLGRSPTVQDFFRIVALAPDFLEARAKFAAQALKPYGQEQRVALALMGATLYTGSRILNQILDGDPHWDKAFSVYHDKKEYGIRTLLGDVQHAVTDPRSFFYNRFSPIARIVTELASGRNDKGIKRSSYEQLADVAKWLVPIPLDVVGKQTTIAAQLLQSAGGRQTPATARFEISKLAHQFAKDAGIETAYDRAGIHVDSDYSKLQRAIEADDTKSATEEYRKLIAGSPGIKPKTARQIAERFSRVRAPFTGSYATERKFVASLDEKQKKVYAEAIKERQDLRDKFSKLPK